MCHKKRFNFRCATAAAAAAFSYKNRIVLENFFFLNQIFDFGGYFVLAISERCNCDLRGVEEIEYSLIRYRCAKKKKSF